MKYPKKSPEEKRKEIERLTEDMNKKMHSFFDSEEKIKEHLQFMSNFYNYSLQNQILIDHQFMGAQAVGSYAFWKSSGVGVNRGEKGIKILVPTLVTLFQNSDNEWVSLNKANKNEKNLIQNGDLETKKKLFFKIGHVFEYTQTNAREKGMEISEIFGRYHRDGKIENDKELMEAFSKLSEKMDIEILDNASFELGTAKGAYFRDKDAVILNHRNTIAENIGVLIHELAHADLHNHKKNAERDQKLSRNEKEYQAEMTAYVVANHYGIDTEGFSLPYIVNWAEDVELEQKKALLQEVHQTSSQFIKTIDDELSILSRDRNSRELEKEELVHGFENLIEIESQSHRRVHEKLKDKKANRSHENMLER